MADKTIQQINTDNNLPNPSGNEVVPAFDPDAPSSTVGIVISALPISTATQTALDAKIGITPAQATATTYIAGNNV